jgi:hypothetical protein
MLERLRDLLAKKESPRAPAPPRAPAQLPSRPRVQRAPGGAPATPPWDASAAAALAPYFSLHAACEHDAVCALVERLAARVWSPAEDPLAARGLLWRDAGALALMLSPSCLLRVSPGLAHALLDFITAGLRARLANEEAARAVGAGAGLARLLALLGDETFPLADEAQAQRLALADAALECLADVLAHHTGPEELQARARRVACTHRHPQRPSCAPPAMRLVRVCRDSPNFEALTPSLHPARRRRWRCCTAATRAGGCSRARCARWAAWFLLRALLSAAACRASTALETQRASWWTCARRRAAA